MFERMHIGLSPCRSNTMPGQSRFAATTHLRIMMAKRSVLAHGRMVLICWTKPAPCYFGLRIADYSPRSGVGLRIDIGRPAWIRNPKSIIHNHPGPWPSGKASPLHGEDRRFESGRVHLLELLVAFLTGAAKSV